MADLGGFLGCYSPLIAAQKRGEHIPIAVACPGGLRVLEHPPHFGLGITVIKLMPRRLAGNERFSLRKLDV